MSEVPRWPRAAWVPILSGLVWLWCAASFGAVGFLFSVIPGCLLLASGVAILLWPGDIRIPEFTALGGLLGIPLAAPSLWVAGPLTGLALIALSAASFLAAGFITVGYEGPELHVPRPRSNIPLAAQVATDEALLGIMQLTLPHAGPGNWERMVEEAEQAEALFEARGWLEKPVRYHQSPPPLREVTLRPARARRVAYEHLSFESGYEPHPEEPGRERWLGYTPNRTAHAWVKRHEGGPRPWLVCVPGFQMGMPAVDLTVFPPEYFHDTLGLNLLIPNLPFHGKRRVGRRSGDGFLAGDALDTIHAEAQAMWDIRRLLSWVRAQDAPAVGVLGLSLGGYQTALLAGLDEEIACAIAGIPLADISRAVWRHGPSVLIQAGERRGIHRARTETLMRVVSPLALEPVVPHERRYIFAGVSDRLVTPDQVRDLWAHWEQPRIEWYQGAHLSFRFHPQVHRFVREALRNSGLVA